ncbi:MAG: hypothetical protein ABSH06_21820 [Thermodesulfobacteriota bacterium]
MPNDPTIEFAQRRFGTDAGLPAAIARTPLPGWLAGAVGDARVPAEADDSIKVEGRVPRRGVPEPVPDGTSVEDLAFYLPFHFYLTAWGIYIRAAGVWALARRFALPRMQPDASGLACAYKLLLEHEHLHFLSEYAASRIEVVTAHDCYAAYFKHEEAGLHEEALANAQALRGLRRSTPSKLVHSASYWMTTQGPGYKDFKEWLPPRFTDGERRAAVFMTIPAAMANRLIPGQTSTTASAYAWHPAEFLFRNTTRPSVPAYIILDLSVPWVRVAKPFPKQFGLQVFVYSNDHNPPHMHIECPPGTKRTRYRWPGLKPLPGDRPLASSEEKCLRQYLAAHGRAIERKITSIPWK